MTKEEIEKQADKVYPNANVVTHEAIEHQGFVKGALWVQNHYESNRLAHCDGMTKEEAGREMEFVTAFVRKNNRTPTFSDAIEMTRKAMIDKACQWLAIVDNHTDEFDSQEEFVSAFRKAMEE